METDARAHSGYRFYRVADDGGYVGVDPRRDAHAGDLVLVDDHDAVLVGLLAGPCADPVLVRPERPPLRLNGHAVLGVVALVVAAT